MHSIFRFGVSTLVCGMLAAATGGVSAHGGQALYSYLDPNGVRILTNVPPKSRVEDLKITGCPDPPAPAPATSAAKPSPAVLKTTPYDAIIHRYAPQFQLDPALVKSVIAQESGFNPKALSPKGARGLMQLMPATAARHGVRNAFDPEENIRGGMKHLRFLLDTFDDDDDDLTLSLALAAYNAGENLVQRIGRVPNIKETSEYVRRVKSRYGRTQMAALAKPQPRRVPSTFRYTDGNGITHLTNIPPVQRQEVSPFALLGTSTP